MVGRAFIETGGGRKTKDDSIDYAAGIILKHRLGDAVAAGEPLAEIRAADAGRVREAMGILKTAIRIGSTAPVLQNVILDRIY
jgi:pyrimidine-nucleoside phosphorylase